MANKKIHNKGQARLFSNPILEALTRSHPLVIWGIYIPLLSYIGYRGVEYYRIDGWVAAGVFASGIFFWSFFEYMAHRYLFHWVTENSRISRITYLLHGNHHEYPRDRHRLFMPPLPSLLISGFLFGIMNLLMGSYAWLFFPGFMLGYLCYASMHYAIHAWHPPVKWLKPLWRNHHLHHYSNEEKGFGVSSQIWDHVFGTTFNLKQYKEDKAKVKQLMFEEAESK